VQNFDVFSFELNEGDMLAMATLEKGSLSGLDPETAEVL
jgi:diketogulonate reductase-like aldo/keto reductase